MLRRVYDLGVNFYDVAECYGDPETILGENLTTFFVHIHPEAVDTNPATESQQQCSKSWTMTG